MNEKKTTGCDLCRRETYSKQWPPPERLAAMPQGDVFLHRCSACGTFWVFDDSGAHIVEEEQARLDFPDAFV